MTPYPPRSPETTPFDTPKMQQVLARLRIQMPPETGVLAESFARQLFDREGSGYMAERDADRLAGLAAAAFGFLAAPRLPDPQVRVFNLEGEGGAAACTVIETLMRDRPFIVDTVQ